MCHYPEVQAKAQAEIDSVVGTDRFPEFIDRDNLVYVSALIMEVLRWQPVGPLGTPCTRAQMICVDDQRCARVSPVYYGGR